MSPERSSIVIMVVGAVLSTEIAWRVWKYMKRCNNAIDDNTKKKNKEHIADQVLIFTENGTLCRDHANTRIPCKKSNCPVGNVNKIQRYLRDAKYTLDVCMYIITCDNLTEAIIRSHRGGARVRFIIDSGMSEHPACTKQILRLLREGIEIRVNKSGQTGSLMHHKFAVIDDMFLLFGSTNWTMQAFYGNNDSIVVTTSVECLVAYSNEFDKMWHDFGLYA